MAMKKYVDFREHALQKQHKLSIEVNGIREQARNLHDWETYRTAFDIGEELCQVFTSLNSGKYNHLEIHDRLVKAEHAIYQLRNKQTNQPNEQED